MEITVKFEFEKEQDWNFDQSILQGVFYSFLNENKKEATYHGLLFWLFTFSNIYPYIKKENYNAWQSYYIKISSIDNKLIEKVYEWLLLRKEVNFDRNNRIKIQKVHLNKTEKIYSWKIIKLVTPVVLSLDEELSKKYNIVNNRDGKPLYWNKDMGFDVFISQLNKNIMKKYYFLIKEWYVWKLSDWDMDFISRFKDIQDFDKTINEIKFFKWFKFKRLALVDFKWWKIAWSLWDFMVDDDKNLIKVLNNVAQIWFGERCTAWFGFII